jgi:hypothetical protein
MPDVIDEAEKLAREIEHADPLSPGDLRRMLADSLSRAAGPGAASDCPCAFHTRERELLARIGTLADANDRLTEERDTARANHADVVERKRREAEAKDRVIEERDATITALRGSLQVERNCERCGGIVLRDPICEPCLDILLQVESRLRDHRCHPSNAGESPADATVAVSTGPLTDEGRALLALPHLAAALAEVPSHVVPAPTLDPELVRATLRALSCAVCNGTGTTWTADICGDSVPLGCLACHGTGKATLAKLVED